MVAERRREIGIRMALGAGQRQRASAGDEAGLVLTGVGIVVGLAGAFALNRLIASLLFGVQPTDPATLVARRRHDHARRGGRVLVARMARLEARSERRVETGLGGRAYLRVSSSSFQFKVGVARDALARAEL